MLLFALVMVATLGYLLLLMKRSRIAPTLPWTGVSAVVLNCLGLGVPLMGYTAFFLILAWCALTGAVVAAISPRWSWFAGTLASPWFLLPYLVWNAVTASPDYVAAYGYVPWDLLRMAIACGGIGAALGTAIKRFLKLSPTILFSEQSNATPPRTEPFEP